MKPTVAIYGIQDRNNKKYPSYVHDHSLAVMDRGKVVTFLQLERWSRRKHDNHMHLHIEKLLDHPDLELPDDFDLVFVDSFVGRSFVSAAGQIRFEAPLVQSLQSQLEKGKSWWRGKEIEAYVLNHELAHIYSNLPFCEDFHEKSLLIHLDGGASMGNFSAWQFRYGQLRLLEHHWDLAYLSKYFNDNALIFAILEMNRDQHLAVPGKLMGYSCYGEMKNEILCWLQQNRFFSDIWSDKASFYEAAKKNFEWNQELLHSKDRFLQDVAAAFQHSFQDELLQKISQLQETTKADYLYFSGGCALNILANTKIVDSNLFRDVFIPPCCSDSGLALGAAAFFEKQKHSTIAKHSPYLNSFAISNYQTKVDLTTVQQIASLLVNKKTIGVCNGYGEIGPRALGNRSILALANDKKLRDHVSMTLKKREWYRPIAPIMLEHNVKKVTGCKKIPRIAEYMLANFPILPEYQNELEGAIHIDGGSRIQCLKSRDSNPFVYELLLHLEVNHNILALLNTSFNQQGEPIVHTKEDAINSAKQMGLDALVINGQLSLLK